jgi:hypothetical protein
MYIPDPCELLEMRQERLIDEWEAAQKGVSAGSFRCPDCQKVSMGEPIAIDGQPDAPVVCYDCLPDALKRAYDEFERHCASNPATVTITSRQQGQHGE